MPTPSPKAITEIAATTLVDPVAALARLLTLVGMNLINPALAMTFFNSFAQMLPPEMALMGGKWLAEGGEVATSAARKVIIDKEVDWLLQNSANFLADYVKK